MIKDRKQIFDRTKCPRTHNRRQGGRQGDGVAGCSFERRSRTPAHFRGDAGMLPSRSATEFSAERKAPRSDTPVRPDAAEFHSTAFHYQEVPPLRSGRGPVAETGQGTGVKRGDRSPGNDDSSRDMNIVSPRTRSIYWKDSSRRRASPRQGLSLIEPVRRRRRQIDRPRPSAPLAPCPDRRPETGRFPRPGLYFVRRAWGAASNPSRIGGQEPAILAAGQGNGFTHGNGPLDVSCLRLFEREVVEVGITAVFSFRVVVKQGEADALKRGKLKRHHEGIAGRGETPCCLCLN